MDRAAPVTLRPGPEVPATGGIGDLVAAFARAKARHPGEQVRRSLCFAGRPVTLDVVGRALADRIGPTFAHLRGRPTVDEPITLSLWDVARTGVPAPAAAAAGELRWDRPDWHLSSHADAGGDHRWLREARPGRVAGLDRRTRHLVAAYDGAGTVSLHEQGRPLARLVAQLYRGLGVQRLHAGLVADGGAGALLLGGSGSGKTSLALDCLAGGLDCLADDVAGLEPAAGGGFTGHSVYGSANLLPFHVRRHPGLRARVRSDDSQDKALLLAPAGMRAHAPITAILVVAAGAAQATRIDPVRRRDVLPLLVPATPEHVHAGFATEDAARLAALVKAVDCHRIVPGADPREVAEAVRGLLARTGR